MNMKIIILHLGRVWNELHFCSGVDLKLAKVKITWNCPGWVHSELAEIYPLLGKFWKFPEELLFSNSDEYSPDRKQQSSCIRIRLERASESACGGFWWVVKNEEILQQLVN